jgi:hypothetical protein
MLLRKIPERTKKYKQGLINMINWIDKFYPIRMMKIIEVGSWTGCASIIFAKRFNKVICVDMWKSNVGGITDEYDMKEVEKIFDRRTELYHGVICKSKMSSLKAAEIYNDKGSDDKLDRDIMPDVVYIDACHTYENTKADLLAWKDIPKKFLCGHDFENRFKGVKKAVREIIGEPDKIFLDSSWIKKLF